MNRRTLPAVTAVAVSAALLLTGCGGDDESNDGKKEGIPGAETGQPMSPTPSASTPEKVNRPQITLPKDNVLVFEGGKTGDPKKDAVLADNAERHRAIDAAIIEGKPDSEAVQFYSRGDAAISAVERIKSVIDEGYSVTGTNRFYNRKVTFRSDGSARLAYCSDESKWFGKDRKTNKPEITAVTKNSYVFYDSSLQKNENGVWQTVDVMSQRGAAQCQP